MNDDKILVRTTDTTIRRGGNPEEIKTEILAENIKLFLNSIEAMLEQCPEEVGKFCMTEFTVSAEVSANGKLVLLGSGVETGINGGLVFKFERTK